MSKEREKPRLELVTVRREDGYEYLGLAAAQSYVKEFFRDMNGVTTLYAIAYEGAPPQFKMFVTAPDGAAAGGQATVVVYIARYEGAELRLVDLLRACRDAVLMLPCRTRLGPCH